MTVALIALPVAAVTVADGIVRTSTDRDVGIDQAMGIADLRVDINGRRPYDIEPRLPKGSRAVPISTTYYEGSIRLMVGDRMVRTRLDVSVLGDPLTAHLARLDSGRLPDGPEEVLVTRSIAAELDVLDGDVVRSGATITAADGTTARVTGIAVEPYCLSCEGIVTSPGSVLESAMLDGSPLPVGYLVDLPDGTDVAALARSWPVDGALVTTRESFADSTPFRGYVFDAAGGPVALLAGLGLIVVVVTAGAVFAVGTRRQIRELGLVAAEGGDERHVRRVVLAQGLVLGVLGAAAGLLLGGVVTVLGVPLWERITDRVMTDLRFGWAELTGIAAVGVVASVVAALVPAYGVARMRPVDALAGRFRTAPPDARLSVAGLLLAIGGLACVVAAGLLVRDSYPDGRLPLLGVIVGTLMAVSGFVLVLPALVTAVGRIGGLLPLSGRLAVRDAVRHRGRTGAAVAAVMVTVTGAIAAAFLLLAQLGEPGRALPAHSMLVSPDALSRYVERAQGDKLLGKALDDMSAAVPGTVVHPLTYATPRDEGPDSVMIFADVPRRTGEADCPGGGSLSIESDLLLRYAQPDDGLRAALADGKVVVFEPCAITPAGTVRFSGNLPAPVELPAYLAKWQPGSWSSFRGLLPGTYLSAETAARLGWETRFDNALVTYPASATEEQIGALRAAAEDAGVDTYVDEPPDSAATGVSFALVGAAGLVALLGAGITVALAAADGRADLATMAALGAQPWRRRTIAGVQALLVTGLGAVAGVVLGSGIGFATTPVSGVVPWQHLVLTGLAVPLLASLLAMAATPGRLPMIQRRQS
jgi:putative ABC transport system permease protein